MNGGDKDIAAEIEFLISNDYEYQTGNRRMLELEKAIKAKTEDKTSCVEYFDLSCKQEERIIKLVVEYLHIL